MNKPARILCCSLCLAASSFAFARGKTALELFNEAIELQNQSQWFEAVDLYRETLEINPQYGEAWFNLAKCSYALGSYDLAVEYADKAAQFAKNFSDVQNLKGISLVSLGKVTEAREVFNAVLKKYPNNIEARFGLAELDLLDGKISVAESRYLDALKRDETNRKALLSLALVSSQMGKFDAAERCIQQALSYHSGEAEVHYLAAYLAARRGEYEMAEQRVRSAVQINGNFDRAYSLLAHILYAQKRYDEVIDICDFRIGRKRDAGDAWFLKGLSQQKLGDNARAISTYESGLAAVPQDEVMRAALELLVASETSIEDRRRDSWASFHYSKAKEYGRNFEGTSERYEYQKALSVSPLNIEMRRSFADMLERDGLYELYLQQLEFIKQNSVPAGKPVQTSENSPKKSRKEILNDDAIESYKSLMANNLSGRWGIDSFFLDKTRWNIGIYFMKEPVQLLHADLEEIAAASARQVFDGVPSTYVDVMTEPVETYGDAFRLARTAGRDYFIILTARETERTFSLDAQIYSARTGTKTSEIHVYRTGNDCMARSLQRFRQGVLDILPIRGKVLRNVQGKLLLDLGKSDGVTKDCEFDIVRKGCVMTKDAGPGITYSKKDVLGTVLIVESDEEISEGEYKKNGFYDTLNDGDEIVLTKTAGKSAEATAATDSRPQADADGNAVTKAAREAEKEALKESLKPASRENELLSLIRSII